MRFVTIETMTWKTHPMGLFNADMFRSLAIGFGLGALAVAAIVASRIFGA